jgi:phosphoribosylamine--glycine ligase
LGSGGREHALAWKYAKSKRIAGLYIAPGNGGTAGLGTNLPDVDPANPEAVLAAFRNYRVDQVFVGPEGPLAMGVVNLLKEQGVPVLGPPREAALLESSKAFSKKFMLRHGIPTPAAREFTELRAFEEYLENAPHRLVIKKSGLAAGKGVLESQDKGELLDFGREILKSDALLAEEYLTGYEISLFALTDGRDWALLPLCADFKKAGEGDEGLNTGGMGAICPVPLVAPGVMETIVQRIVEPTFKGMEKEGLSYQGVLYFGLMICPEGPYLLEYNTRFGDPECQVLLPQIESDFGDLTEAILNRNLASFPIEYSHYSALGVVIAAPGYPGEYEKGLPLEPLPVCPEEKLLIFHSSTTLDSQGRILTGGGRCFTVVGLGQNIFKASSLAYEAAPKVRFPGAWFRKDIGKKFFME